MDIDTTPELVSNVYSKIKENVVKYRNVTGRPLTLTEKILSGHLYEIPDKTLTGGKDYVFLKPDRVALQDVTGQMVMLQFMQAGLKQSALPTTVHCDHLIRAEVQGDVDMKVSLDENSEVFKFLQSAAAKHGCGFWKPGAGIIHQVVLENYAFPGGLMIGTDSHTPNAGGLGMIAVGVGGLDAAETMAGLPWELLYPKKIGVKLTGELNGWTAPKDIILKVAEELTVSGGTNSIVEYFGPGTKSISCTGKATITNMGAEIGATCSIFPYDERMETYLKYTNREKIAELANQSKELLVADPEVELNPEIFFDRVIEINLSTLEPHIVGPHTPDLARTISELGEDVKSNDYVDPISVALIGSCTNSSYEDMSRVASIAQQAKEKGIQSKVPLLITPGSEQIRGTIERDGQMDSLKEIGATVLANACGPCIGQWNRPELQNEEKNTIVTTFNRNFPGRNDGHRSTLNFIGSPEMIIALALGGRLSFNPLKDELTASDGTKFKLDPPKPAPEVPENGFMIPEGIFIAPPEKSNDVEVIIDPNSKRLQLLEPFSKWDGKDFVDLPILVKAKGKCTTDHISPAGAWLSLRGHLDNLSDNMLLGAVNAFNDEVGKGKNILNNQLETFSNIARQYKEKQMRWVIIGDNNYGEGSSREHAAMSPRYLGCAAVITKSLARIHETNLKKQGILALTFSNPDDYEKILEDDKISLIELNELEPHKQVKCIISHRDESKDEILLNHSYNQSQIGWFKAGSALNVLRNR
ncbi:aconitate hydratase [Nitrosopumilus ureiphilus]|uniref:Aconitate hydratase n=1 Tax=Nitrosopumilus ureiphilus TaxID=1470067 RepID=A0A7D5R330_9ARCH|nr:aconitate hydratase [Nitrosopumilus ureiphilus]QLH08036.1 aconitate hydratase [Nitrosopumilus ureiphilus]